jgi:hypothetical protein
MTRRTRIAPAVRILQRLGRIAAGCLLVALSLGAASPATSTADRPALAVAPSTPARLPAPPAPPRPRGRDAPLATIAPSGPTWPLPPRASPDDHSAKPASYVPGRRPPRATATIATDADGADGASTTAAARAPRPGSRPDHPAPAVEPGIQVPRRAFAPAPAAGWRWPLPGRPRVVRAFDPPLSRYGPGHRGVDLAAPPGTPVLAAGAGVVAFAGILAGRGVLSILHAGGLRTTYEPVQATLAVGARVAAGAVVGRLVAGHPGCPVAACLHWGLRRGKDYLDPLDLLRRGPIRLLPLADPVTQAPARRGQAGPAAADAPPAADPASHHHAQADQPPSLAEGRGRSRAATAGPAGRHPAPRPSSVAIASSAGIAIALALLISRRRPP